MRRKHFFHGVAGVIDDCLDVAMWLICCQGVAGCLIGSCYGTESDCVAMVLLVLLTIAWVLLSGLYVPGVVRVLLDSCYVILVDCYLELGIFYCISSGC